MPRRTPGFVTTGRSGFPGFFDEKPGGQDDKKDYKKAQELYEKLISLNPKDDIDVAYYHIAMCKWKNEDMNAAIDPFAKCVVLNKKTAQKAREHLESIIKAGNGTDSLEGLDEALAKAKADLGIN